MNEVILKQIEKLQACTQVDVQLGWQYNHAEIGIFEPISNNGDRTDVSLNAKGHISWLAGKQVLWLKQKFVIPDRLQGYCLTGLTLRLSLTWWAENAQIFVNGCMVQEGDLFDSSARVVLSQSAKPGEEILVSLRLVSPGHDSGALMRSLLLYEYNDSRLDPGFVSSELTNVYSYIIAFCPEKLHLLAEAIAQIDWESISDREKFDRSLLTLRQNLQQSSILNSNSKLPGKIHLLGHAHLDMAWLWTLDETWQVAQRTFESVLKLQQDFPSLIFCHSTPALYEWIEQNRPDLFTAIQEQVKLGLWEIVGGMWIEPELNLINGESIVRQILYGQRYIQAKFDRLMTVAWLPDTFGFCWQLPQLLKQGGIEYFVTQKLRWNDTTEFPYQVFWWESPDRTQILSLMSAPIGEGIDPVKMTKYAIDWQTKTNLTECLWLPGVGDHGGGPTRDMLEIAKRWQDSPFFPQQQFTTASKYLSSIVDRVDSKIETWNNELYLEFHRGCYTTHADQKRSNRYCEGLLYQAELFASLANISVGAAYPQTELEVAWKKTLFNQFHDILPGTSINQVFVEANQSWQEVEQAGMEILQTALSAIASNISLPTPPQPDALPVVVFNSLNWTRSHVVSITLPASALSGDETALYNWQIYDLQGQKLDSQLTDADTLLFLANDIPSVGYRLFWLCFQPPITAEPEPISYWQTDSHNTKISLKRNTNFVNKKISTDLNWVLENQLLRVIVDPETGDLASIYDKIAEREILDRGNGNQLQAFTDAGQYWDAWNIDPKYAEYPASPTKLKTIYWVDRGELQQRLRVIRILGKSEFCQDYILETASPLLKIATKVDWQENHVLVKAAFSFKLTADKVTYEIACGAIERPTEPKTSAEQAKWEVPALRWADLTEDEYGVSLLNDCKYGYDARSSQLRLTLLRSSTWPDPEADRGKHEFTYAIYPHGGNWQSAHTVRRGYELNLPLQVMVMPAIVPKVDRHNSIQLPPVSKLLDLSANNLILSAFKQSEDNPHQWILRCYESHGETAQLSLQSDLGLKIAYPVDILERSLETDHPLLTPQTFKIEPWKIASFTLMLEKTSNIIPPECTP